MTDKFVRIAPRLDNFASNKEIYPGMTEKDVAKKLSYIYLNYTPMGLYIPNDSARGAGAFCWQVSDMLNDIRKVFGVSLSRFSYNFSEFYNMGADEVLKLIVAEMRANQATKIATNTINTSMQQTRRFFMSKFFAEQDMKPLEFSKSLTFASEEEDNILAIKNYINETVVAYINKHKNALVHLYGEKDRLTKENENLKRIVEQMSKDIERLQKELKGKADRAPFVR